jgi:hypothetical protein
MKKRDFFSWECRSDDEEEEEEEKDYFAKVDRKLQRKKMEGESCLKIQMRANVAGLATEFKMMQRREFLGCRFVGRDLALYTCWVFDSFSTSFRHVRFVVGVAPTRYGHGLSIGTFAVASVFLRSWIL